MANAPSPETTLSDDDIKRIIRQGATEMIALQKTCTHSDWNFAEHGRCCWTCGTFMIDFGD